MSHKHPSACIPPPSDYTPRTRPPRAGAYRDRGGRGHRGRANYNRGTNFHKDESQEERDDNYNKLKDQPKDRFHRSEDDDYFARVEEEEEEDQKGEEQLRNDHDHMTEQDEDCEDDPLDAYMKSLESKTKNIPIHGSINKDSNEDEAKVSEEPTKEAYTSSETERKAVRLDIDETDDIEESYYKYLEQSKSKAGTSIESEEDLEEKQNLVEYDKDGNILSVRKVKREIEPLPPIDHSKIVYEDFRRNFYKEHSEIEKLSDELSEELRRKLDIKVSGELPPKPVCSFAHFNFDEQLMKVIRRSDYTQPTPIQSQAIPAALLGRNVIGIATTGSGKTAAYLWPMIVHVMGQPDLKRGDGPIGLILVPTRELALQVYSEAKKFSKSYKIEVVCAYGGGSKYEQTQDLEAGAEIIVATPGRLIDLIKLDATNLRRVTYLVLDEADRFFEMGFEAQVRSICDQIRPDRQTLLFSATFKERIEQLARTVTDNPIKIVQKALGEANEDVTQHIIVLPDSSKKWNWLTGKLVEFTSSGSVLIFVTRILNAEELNKNLNEFGQNTLLLHGDMEQSERNRVITLFKRKEKDIMIATDVAARGLDISHIRTVINYDVARDIDTHVHRVGRTGRAGLKGDAYTLVTVDRDKEFAALLLKNLESSNQEVPKELLTLAMQSRNYRKSRNDHSRHDHHRGSRHNYHHPHHHSGHESSYRSHHRDFSEHHRHDRPHHPTQPRPPYRSHNPNNQHQDDRKRPRWH